MISGRAAKISVTYVSSNSKVGSQSTAAGLLDFGGSDALPGQYANADNKTLLAVPIFAKYFTTNEYI